MMMRKKKSSENLKLLTAVLLAYVAAMRIIRPWYLRWGTTDAELVQPLPGDELMDHVASNHAISIHAPATAVWPWLVQIGQNRAGFYSYTFLENLLAADMHNSDRIKPEWQQLKVGDKVRLASKAVYGDFPLLEVAALEKNHYLVLKGWGAFVLQPVDAHTIRLIIRSHAGREGAFTRMARLLLLDPVHFIMERGMLLGIKKRVEGAESVPSH